MKTINSKWILLIASIITISTGCSNISESIPETISEKTIFPTEDIRTKANSDSIYTSTTTSGGICIWCGAPSGGCDCAGQTGKCPQCNNPIPCSCPPCDVCGASPYQCTCNPLAGCPNCHAPSEYCQCPPCTTCNKKPSFCTCSKTTEPSQPTPSTRCECYSARCSGNPETCTCKEADYCKDNEECICRGHLGTTAPTDPTPPPASTTT